MPAIRLPIVVHIQRHFFPTKTFLGRRFTPGSESDGYGDWIDETESPHVTVYSSRGQDMATVEESSALYTDYVCSCHLFLLLICVGISMIPVERTLDQSLHPPTSSSSSLDSTDSWLVCFFNFPSIFINVRVDHNGAFDRMRERECWTCTPVRYDVVTFRGPTERKPWIRHRLLSSRD